MPRLQHVIAALAIFGCSAAAMGQYVWLNEKGVKQYSDVPPPASVPNSRILKSPGGLPRADNAASGDDAGASGDDSAKKTPAKSLAEQNADFEKRRAEKAEKDKQAADKAKQEEAKKKNCEQALNYSRALASGQRIANVNAAGERAYMTDEERAQEVSKTQQTLAGCK